MQKASLSLIILAAAALAGWLLRMWLYPVLPAVVEYRLNTTPQYALINPLIFTESDQRLYPEFDGLDAAINRYVKGAESDGDASSVSVYFRELNNGHWTGTDENETYEPSSMLKVAVMIAYLRSAMAQSNLSNGSVEGYLSQRLYYPGADEAGQHYTSAHHLAPGYRSMSDLIDTMIVDSDNVATKVLVSDNESQFQSVYEDFRLPPTPTGSVTDYMTARSYSVVFRALYNASYLPRSLSEQALELLTKTDFTEGLVAGVPKDTVIAHKFGEHTYALSDGTAVSRELHDCGIVYYPDHPYFLCIMTKGHDFPKLQSVISGLSKLIYDYVAETNTVKH